MQALAVVRVVSHGLAHASRPALPEAINLFALALPLTAGMVQCRRSQRVSQARAPLYMDSQVPTTADDERCFFAELSRSWHLNSERHRARGRARGISILRMLRLKHAFADRTNTFRASSRERGRAPECSTIPGPLPTFPSLDPHVSVCLCIGGWGVRSFCAVIPVWVTTCDVSFIFGQL